MGHAPHRRDFGKKRARWPVSAPARRSQLSTPAGYPPEASSSKIKLGNYLQSATAKQSICKVQPRSKCKTEPGLNVVYLRRGLAPSWHPAAGVGEPRRAQSRQGRWVESKGNKAATCA